MSKHAAQRIELTDAERALVLDAIAEQMKAANADVLRAGEAAARAALRHVAAVAVVLAPRATHAVLALADPYESPYYRVDTLRDESAMHDPTGDGEPVWEYRWSGASELTTLLGLVSIHRDHAAPLAAAGLSLEEAREAIGFLPDDGFLIRLADFR